MEETRKFKLMYIFTYAPIGVLCPLIGQYLSSIGFSGTQIGTITSVATVSSVFASTFWGDRYSNSSNGKRVIITLCICAAFMSMVNSFVTVFVIFVGTYALMYFFQGPVMGLCDAMVLEEGRDFASIRLFGAIGYAASVFVGGRLSEVFGLSCIFILYSITYVVGALILSTMSKKNVKKKQKKEEKLSFKLLFSEKKAILLILCGIFLFGSNVANNTYFSFLYRDGGGSVAGVGVIFLLMVGSEAPFMAIAPKLASRFTQEKLIAAAMGISVLRFTLYAFGPSYKILLATFFLQGMVNGVLLVEYMKYISKVVDSRLIGLAVSAFYAVSSNGGTILCNFFGGVAMDMLGSQGVYMLFAVLNGIGLCLYLLFGLHRQESKKNSKKLPKSY